METRLRDFIETWDDLIFSVVDDHNEDGVHCLLRYVASPDGERVRNGVRYRKMGFDEAYEYIRLRRPDYLKGVMVVPNDDVYRHYEPRKAIREVLRTDRRVQQMVRELDGVPGEDMGITGSKLVGLGAETSDVDFVVYGDSWFKARDLLQKAIAEGRIDGIDGAGWKQIYAKRKPELTFDEFYVHERRKGNRCMLDGALADLLFVRSRDQIGPKVPVGKDLGMQTITAKVTNAHFAFDSPAIYEVDHPEIGRVLSFTHTYAGQALAGEMIEARGRLEASSDGNALVIGTSREPRGEWIKSLTLLEK